MLQSYEQKYLIGAANLNSCASVSDEQYSELQTTGFPAVLLLVYRIDELNLVLIRSCVCMFELRFLASFCKSCFQIS